MARPDQLTSSARRVRPPLPGRASLFAGTVTALLVLGALWGLVAARVGWLLRVDASIDRAAHRAVLAHPDLLSTARVVTQFGNPTTMDVVVGVVALLLLAWQRDVTGAVTVVVVRVVSLYAGNGLKDLVHRARPHLPHPVDHVAGFSFPSGHAYGSAAAAFPVACLVAAMRPAVRRPVIALCVAWPVLVGASRVLLGVHWPSDVVAGLALTAAVAGAVLLLRRLLSSR